MPLKYLSNFWRSLNIPLINCEAELILTWFKNCVLINKSTKYADYNADPIVYEIDNPEDPIFQITDTKLYVPVVTLSNENDINLNYLIDPIFTNVNRLFVLSFARNNNTDSRYSYSIYYLPKVKINDFNVLTDGKSFFNLPVKNEEEAYEKIIEMMIIQLVIYEVLLISKKIIN